MKRALLLKSIILCIALFLTASVFLTMTSCGSDETQSEPTWYLTIYDEGDDSGSPVHIKQSSPEGNHIPVPAEKYGNTFLGFYTADGVCFFDAGGNQVPGTLIQGDMSLYRHWEYATCEISYYTVDSEGNSTLYTTDEVKYNSSIGDMPVPQSEGKDFLGWYSSFSLGEDGTLNFGKALSDGDGKPLSGCEKLTDDNYKFADYSSNEVSVFGKFGISRLNVTFDFNDGVTPSVSQEVDYGTKLSDIEVPAMDDGTKMIAGWSFHASGGIEFTDEITSDVTLYAIWKEYCTVNLHITDIDSQQIKVFRNEYYDEEPVRNGYEFLGWYTNLLFSGNPVFAISYSNVTDYYAKWSLINYTVELIVDGAVYDRYTYDIEKSVELPVLDDRDGAAFMGWCASEDLSDEPVTQLPVGTYGVTKLYPKWHDYTELYCYSDNSVSAVIEARFDKRFSIALPEIGEDREFVCWYIVIDNVEIPITDDKGNSLDVWTYKDERMDVYAKFRNYVTISLSYIQNGETFTSELGRLLEGNSVTINRPASLSGYVTKFYAGGELLGEGASVQYTVPSSDVTVEIKCSLPLEEEMTEALNFNVYSFNGHYYAAIKYKAGSWHDAKAYCEFYGGHLVTITSAAEQNAVAIIMTNEDPGNFSYWLGATDEEQEGNWKWVTGEAFGYTNWGNTSNRQEPSGGTSENYLEFYKDYTDYRWNDASNRNSNYIICEWDRKGDALIPMTRTLTDIDGNEVDFNIYNYGGHYYSFITNKKAWGAAERYAEYLGGYLACITSENENAYITSANKYLGLNKIYLIGATDYEKEGTWKWASGETFSYSNWTSGEPNNSSGNEDYAVMNANGRWNDINGTEQQCFIIEWSKLSDIGHIRYGNYYRQVSTPSQLAALSGTDANYEVWLTGDIDLTDYDWTAIDFRGKLYGEGYSVIGLTDSLFLTLYGTVENLTLEDVNLVYTHDGTNVASFGALCRSINGGTVDGVNVYGTISSTGAVDVGAIAGAISGGNVSITNSKNYASISGTGVSGSGSSGGILGSTSSCKALVFSGNENYGAISGGLTGGLIGYSNLSYTIKDCYNYGAVSGTVYVGGFVGQVASKSITVDGGKNIAKVSGEDKFGKYVGSGSATYNNLQTVEISSVDDLWLLDKNIAQESFVLTDDLDLSGIESWTMMDLAASLDGDGHVISGLNLESDKAENLALFNNISGTISDITFENVVVSSESYESVKLGIIGITLTGKISGVTIAESCSVSGGAATAGAFVSIISGGTVENCTNNAVVTTHATTDVGATGGIAGEMNNGVITDTVNNGDIVGIYRVGGLVGYATLNARMSNCQNTAAVTGKNAFTGGIAGRWAANVNSSASLLKNSGAVTGEDNVGGIFGKIEYSSDYALNGGYENTGSITGNNNVGGLFGWSDQSTYKLTISGDSVNSGDVNGYDYVGGIGGYLRVKYLNISGAENTGDVLAENSFAGGIVGYAGGYDYSSIISECTSSASVSAKFIVGGLAGHAENITLDSCDNEGSVITATGYRTEDNQNYVYLGGYAGSCGGVKNCINKAAISYDGRGGRIGGIAGYAYNYGIFSGCENTAEIYAPNASYVGGVIGGVSNSSNVTLSKLTNSGKVTGSDNVGGIAGSINATASAGYQDLYRTLTLTSFENSGEVSGNNNVGGTIGYLYTDATSNRTALYKITANEFTNSGNVSGVKYVGGLLGYARSDDNSSSLTGGISSGAVEAESYIGGLVGKAENIKFIDCSNEGSELKATGYVLESDVTYVYFGGYAGFGYSFENCHNAVMLSYSGNGARIGGIAGYANGTFTECSNTADITAENANEVGGIVGRVNHGGNATLQGLTNSGTIIAKDSVGGIAGSINATASAGYQDLYCTLTLTSFENSGDVSGSNNVGGTIGYLYTDATSNRTALYKITANEFTNSGNVSGVKYVGGLLGYARSDDNSSYIMNYSFTGVVTAESDFGDVAGKLENISIK